MNLEKIRMQIFDLGMKRMLTYDGQFNTRQRFKYFGGGIYKGAFCEVIISYQCKNKIFLVAKEIVNQTEKQRLIGEQITELLRNPEDIIQFAFKMLIPIKNNEISIEDLNKAKFRIRKKITKFKALGKII